MFISLVVKLIQQVVFLYAHLITVCYINTLTKLLSLNNIIAQVYKLQKNLKDFRNFFGVNKRVVTK